MERSRRRVGELENALIARASGWGASQDDDHYKAVVDNVADAIVINVGVERVLINRAYLTLYGLDDASQLSGVPLDHFIAPEDRPFITEYLNARERGDPLPGALEYRIVRPSGELRTVEASAVATNFRGQKATFAVLRDITERKEAEEEARRHAQEMATLYSVAHMLAQPGSFKERVSNVLQSLVDLTRADQVALRVPGHRGEGLEAIAAAGPAVQEDMHGLLPYAEGVSERVFIEGTPVIVNDYRTSPLAVAESVATGIESIAYLPVMTSGRSIGVLDIVSRDPGHFTDDRVRLLTGVAEGVGALVENARLYETLQLNAEELARSNADLEQFAYVASHDLQEPLRSVVGFTSLLARRYEGKLDENADRFIGRAVAAASRMQVLINDLLTYSRVGRNTEQPESVDMEVLLAQEIEALHGAINASGSKVTHGPLPSVVADSTLVRQILHNLIGNAIKFRGEEPPRIHVSADDMGDEWKFAVGDNGIGIDPQFAERIFTIFQRLHTREEYEGTGIGLSICRKAAEQLGGRIWVESQLGKGSTFYFTVPIKSGS